MSAIKPIRLGDIITLKRGYDLPAKDRLEGQYPIISSAGISGYHNEYKVEGEGVVTGRYGTLGNMYFVDENYWGRLGLNLECLNRINLLSCCHVRREVVSAGR